MIFEKEDKYLGNEEKLKQEDRELTDLEQEVKQLEMKLKEKSQESNLMDFKLREIVRKNDIDMGFLKPHSGIHAGVLSSQAGAALGPSISLANQRSPQNINSSMDVARLQSKQSNRSMSRFSVASRVSKYDDETISTSQKRKYDLPKLKVDRNDTDYNKIITGQVKVPSVSKSLVSSNKLPSHLRGGNFYIRN